MLTECLDFLFFHSDWNILTSWNMKTIARQVPTSLNQLASCGLSDQIIQKFGKQIVATVMEFLHFFELKQYVSDKEVNHTTTKEGDKTTNNGNIMVLPQKYTDILKGKLKDCVSFWAREVSCGCDDIYCA